MYVGPNRAREKIPIHKAEGVTVTETYLGNLCDRTFLSLWSYPGVFRDQNRRGAGDGKELCDILVVFDQHVLIFSDKHCEFPDTGDATVDWQRWYKRAVLHSAEQAWGAERWLKQHPDRVFLDRACKTKFPLQIPEPEKTKYHLIVVAHGCEDRCKATHGGSGSLMLISSPRTPDNEKPSAPAPFSVRDLDLQRTFVHVFTKTTLDAALRTLDTAPDFIEYLDNKVALFRSNTTVYAPGEEDLLASYLKHATPAGRYGFSFRSDLDGVVIEEGAWDSYRQSSSFAETTAFLECSYAWDNLISRFSRHAINATQYYSNHTELSNTEISLRFMAREPRIARKHLVDEASALVFGTPEGMRRTKVMGSVSNGGAFYIFLCLHQSGFPSNEVYRQVRSDMLEACCIIGKHRFPKVENFVGIAFAPAIPKGDTSEDLLYLDAREWSEEQEAEAIRLQQKLGLLTSPDLPPPEQVTRQAIITNSHIRRMAVPRVGRNDRCPCGSGKKYKKCCCSNNASEEVLH